MAYFQIMSIPAVLWTQLLKVTFKIQYNLVIMPPFVQPKFGVIKRFGDRSREIYNESKGKIRN